jgi:hypothetical protein
MTMNRRLTLGAALTVALAFGPDAAALPIIDPAGDTFNTGTHDLVSYELALAGGVFTATLNFAGPIAPASAGAANSVVGFIDLDTDQNPATGGTAPFGGPVPGGNSFLNFFIMGGLIPGPTIPIGDEFYVDLFSEFDSPGLVDVVDTTTNTVVDTVPITYFPSSLQFSIPAATLGGASAINFDVLVGDMQAPTDRAPNGGAPAVSTPGVPEPGVLTLSLVGLGVMMRRRRRIF